MDYYFEKFGDLDSNKPLILIDFDHTLSDFTQMKRAIKLNCSRIGIRETDWDEAYLDATTKLHVVRMDEQIEALAKKYNIPVGKVHDTFYIELNDSSKYLFEDVIPFLNKYSETTNILLFTLGNEEFQKVKRKSSGIDKYLKGAIYTTIEKDLWLSQVLVENEFGNLLIKDLDINSPTIYIIDDRPSSFDKLVNTFNSKLKLVRLRRIGGRYEDEEDIVKTEDIKSLSDFNLT